MTTLKRFGKLRISMYAGDHPPAHVHVRTSEGEAQVNLETLEVVGSLRATREAGPALEWVREHRGELLKRWEEANG